MSEEKAGKYTVQWLGIKDENGVLHPPGQLPKDMIDSIVNVILQEVAITMKTVPIDPNKDRVVYAEKIEEFLK